MCINEKILICQVVNASTAIRLSLSGTAIPQQVIKIHHGCGGHTTARADKEEPMEGALFLVLWIGCASLHTLYDIKVKPHLQAWRREEDFS